MKLFQLLLTAALLLLGSNVFAGQYKADPVFIDLNERIATGNLYETRFSSHPSERIGCAVANGDERGLFGYCEAKYYDPGSQALLEADCFTYDTKMIEAIGSINTYSYVYFSWESQSRKGFDNNVCTNVTVATRSTHIPQEGGLNYAEIEPNFCTDRINPDGYANHFTLPEVPEGHILFVRSIAFKKSGGGWFPLFNVDIFGNGFWLWGWHSPEIPTPSLYVGFQNIDVRIPQPPEWALLKAEGTLSCDTVPVLSIFYHIIPSNDAAPAQ